MATEYTWTFPNFEADSDDKVKTIQTSKPEKKKGKDKLSSSMGKKVNKSYYQYSPLKHIFIE